MYHFIGLECSGWHTTLPVCCCVCCSGCCTILQTNTRISSSAVVFSAASPVPGTGHSHAHARHYRSIQQHPFNRASLSQRTYVPLLPVIATNARCCSLLGEELLGLAPVLLHESALKPHLPEDSVRGRAAWCVLDPLLDRLCCPGSVVDCAADTSVQVNNVGCSMMHAFKALSGGHEVSRLFNRPGL